ncbi:hypothetical protein PVBG_05911 [Plasmodium vivax Brazil I]|uniref:VIR protein n=1 Tax=Plasmodium vivax (strain Brazil I) TaxID=1033975 RepID=A0A0J9T1Z8_PLAV1|nr:hypothetical protein PVBG_05911 [Plasmodium vivax Brazil I]
MSSNRSNPWYFEYQDYIKVKNIFNYTPRDTFDVTVAKDLIRGIKNTREKELILLDTFYDLKKLVQRHDCFYVPGPETCCKYINYWLNKTVRDSEYNVNDKNFNIFDKFMRDDPKIQDSSIDCISRLSYMDNDTFKKTKKLYDLYDYFTKLKESKVPTTLCHNISFLTEKYESVFQECKDKDNNLCDKLTNLKNVIVKDKLVANNICTKEAFDSFILKIDPPREEQKAVTAHAHGRISGETHTTHHVSVPSSHAQGLREQARVERERTSSVPQQQLTAELPRLPLKLPALPALPALPSEPSEPSEPLEESERTGPMGPIGLEPELRLEHPQEHDVYHLSDDERYNFPEEGDPSAGSMQPTFNTETLMERMKIAVSNVFEQVEPAPILGVSGGMGALFLLFKVFIALKIYPYVYNTFKKKISIIIKLCFKFTKRFS